MHQQVLPDQRAHCRHDEERRDHHQADDVAPDHGLVEQQRQRHAEQNRDAKHRADQDERVLQRGEKCGIGEEVAEIFQSDEASPNLDRAGCSATSKNRSSAPAARSSRRTAGQPMARAGRARGICVCWVAIACSTVSRERPSRPDEPDSRRSYRTGRKPCRSDHASVYLM